MIKHGLLVCSFQLKTKYKKTEDLYSVIYEPLNEKVIASPSIGMRL